LFIVIIISLSLQPAYDKQLLNHLAIFLFPNHWLAEADPPIISWPQPTTKTKTKKKVHFLIHSSIQRVCEILVKKILQRWWALKSESRSRLPQSGLPGRQLEDQQCRRCEREKEPPLLPFQPRPLSLIAKRRVCKGLGPENNRPSVGRTERIAKTR